MSVSTEFTLSLYCKVDSARKLHLKYDELNSNHVLIKRSFLVSHSERVCGSAFLHCSLEFMFMHGRCYVCQLNGLRLVCHMALTRVNMWISMITKIVPAIATFSFLPAIAIPPTGSCKLGRSHTAKVWSWLGHHVTAKFHNGEEV